MSNLPTEDLEALAKLRYLWNEVRQCWGPDYPISYHDLFALLFQLVYYQGRYGSLLPVEEAKALEKEMEDWLPYQGNRLDLISDG